MGLGTEPSTAQHQDSTGIDPSHGLGARPAPWGPGGLWGPAVGVCAPFLSGCTLPHVPQHFCHPLPGTVFAIWSSGVPQSGLGGGTGLCGDTAPQCLGMCGGAMGLPGALEVIPAVRFLDQEPTEQGPWKQGSQCGVPRTRVRGGEDARNWVPGVQGGPGLPGPHRCPARGSPTAEDSFGARSPAAARGRDGRTGSPREGGRRCGAGGRWAGGCCGSGFRDFV